MGIVDVSGHWSLVYSFNFEIRLITATNQHFSENNGSFSVKASLAWVNFLKKNKCYQIFQFEFSLLPQASKQKKQIFLRGKLYIKTFKDMVVDTVAHNFITVNYSFKKWAEWGERNKDIWYWQEYFQITFSLIVIWQVKQ